MIEMLEGFPDHVVAIAASGHVTKQDYDDMLVPRVDEALAKHQKIRCYYELGPRFDGFDAGAAGEDFRVGLGHLTRWDRVAVVTDVGWIGGAMKLFGVFIPGEVRVFATEQAAEARGWICGP